MSLVAGPCFAQQVRYILAPGDTIRYHEVTESHIELRPARGPVTFTGHHDATIAMVGERGDTARAWYEQLTLVNTTPDGERRPNTGSALHLPFRLLLAHGGVTTISAPTFDDSIAAQSDLTREFEDFFITVVSTNLPDPRWVDMVENSGPGHPNGSFQSHHLRRFHLLRDTVTADHAPAWLIAVDQDIDFQSSTPLQDRHAIVTTRLTGHEDGTAVFATRAGRLVTRERHGRLEGTQVFEGQGRHVELPIVFEYTSRLDLVQ